MTSWFPRNQSDGLGGGPGGGEGGSLLDLSTSSAVLSFGSSILNLHTVFRSLFAGEVSFLIDSRSSLAIAIC